MITDVLNPLAAAVETFANLVDAHGSSTVTSTRQVEQLFSDALKKVGRPDAKLMTLPADERHAAEFRENQSAVRAWLVRLASLSPLLPRDWDRAARSMRQALAPTLGRLKFITTVEFNTRGDKLRIVPTKFGVEGACYLVIAAMLEKGTTIRARRCPERGCRRFAIARGGVKGKKRQHCAEHSQQHSKRRAKAQGD